jgi:hypothetical protein
MPGLGRRNSRALLSFGWVAVKEADPSLRGEGPGLKRVLKNWPQRQTVTSAAEAAIIMRRLRHG